MENENSPFFDGEVTRDDLGIAKGENTPEQEKNMVSHALSLIEEFGRCEDCNSIPDELGICGFCDTNPPGSENQETPAPWDHVEYHISESYLSAIFNGDDSGLEGCEERDCDTCEICELDAFLEDVTEQFGPGHWSCPDDTDETDFGTCDICGLGASIVNMKYMIRPKEVK